MKRLAVIALVLIFSIACDDTETSASDQNVAMFNSILLASNELPTVTNADASASGTLQLRLNLTTDAGGAITGATGEFTIFMTGFPANTSLTGAHIHQAPAGVIAGVFVGVGDIVGQVLPTGQATFTRTVSNITAAQAQAIVNNPSGFYFNVHTTLNTPGAIRGQLVRVN
jgi:hypothetical protein